MSYCRWSSDSDVYCFWTGDDWETHVTDGQTFSDSTLADFKARLLRLRESGHRVPDRALGRVNEEIAQGQNRSADSD